MQSSSKRGSRFLLKQEFLQKLSSEINRVLPRSRQSGEEGCKGRKDLLKVIVASLPQFPPELRPPALRRGDYYREIALAIIECDDLSFLYDERIRFSLFRVIRWARGDRDWLLQQAIDTHPQGTEQIRKFTENLDLLLDFPVAVIPPTDLG